MAASKCKFTPKEMAASKCKFTLKEMAASNCKFTLKEVAAELPPLLVLTYTYFYSTSLLVLVWLIISILYPPFMILTVRRR